MIHESNRISVIISLLLLSIAACSVPNANASLTPVENFKFGIIFSIGGLGDMSFNDAVYRGMMEVNNTYTGNTTHTISFDYVEPTSNSDYSIFQRQYAATGLYDLIICVGFSLADTLKANAIAYPTQKWMIIDNVVNEPNVKSIIFNEQEGSFLVVAMAGMTTNTSKIGFIGGLNNSLINEFKSGYEQGAHYINSAINVTTEYSPNPDFPWGDIPGGKALAKNMNAAGNDIIFAAAGGTGIGVIQAASESSNLLAIGADYDQDYISPGKILCSMIKNFEIAVIMSCKAVINDSWKNGIIELDINDEGVGISNMTYSMLELQ